MFCLVFQLESRSQISPKAEADEFFSQKKYSSVMKIADDFGGKLSLNKTDRISILETGIRSALELERLDKVDVYFKQLLQVDPQYKPIPEIVEERFVSYYSKYVSLPLLTFTLTTASLLPRMRVDKSYSANPDIDYDNSDYSSTIWFHNAGRFNLYPWHHHGIGLSLGNPDFDYTRTLSRNSSTPSSGVPIESVEYREENKAAMLGLTYNWSPLRNEYLAISANVGSSAYFLRESAGSAKVKFTPASGLDDIESARKIRDDVRRKVMPYADLGVDVRANVGKLGFTLEAHYYRALQHYNLSTGLNGDSELLNKYYYLDNDVYADLFVVSIGVSYSLWYKVR